MSHSILSYKREKSSETAKSGLNRKLYAQNFSLFEFLMPLASGTSMVAQHGVQYGYPIILVKAMKKHQGNTNTLWNVVILASLNAETCGKLISDNSWTFSALYYTCFHRNSQNFLKFYPP